MTIYPQIGECVENRLYYGPYCLEGEAEIFGVDTLIRDQEGFKYGSTTSILTILDDIYMEEVIQSPIIILQGGFPAITKMEEEDEHNRDSIPF